MNVSISILKNFDNRQGYVRYLNFVDFLYLYAII